MSTTRQEEISLRELFEILLRARWVLLSVPMLFAVAAGAIASWLPKQYQATVVVVPASNGSGAGRLGGLAGQLGGLASLAGISTLGSTERAESLAVLQSEWLTGRYVLEADLLPLLFPEQWDPAAKAWRADAGAPPTLWLANQKFRKIRQVVDDKKSGLITVTVTWTDPLQAADWANALVRSTNQLLRAKAIEESERHIKYLSEQAAANDVAQVRAAIYSLLESEIKSIMLARGTEEYALRVIDPAVVPERKSGPGRVKWVVTGFAAGMVLALLVTFVMAALRRSAPGDRQ